MHDDSRTLVLMRHAKAEAVAPSDLERALTERGRADAAAAGRWLADRGTVPDHALVSTAVRTRETWTASSGEAGWDVTPDFDSALYAAGTDAALDLVRLVPAGVGTLLVIGHNPTVATLAQLLSDGTGEAEVLRRMTEGYPPTALTVFEVPGEWASLDVASSRVLDFHVARG